MASATLQDTPLVETFFNVAETETLALFEHLRFESLKEFDVFAPAETGRTREHEPPEMMRGFLHCYYHDIYGIRPVGLMQMLRKYRLGFRNSATNDLVQNEVRDFV